MAEKAFFPSALIRLELSEKAFVAKNSPKVSTPLKPAFFEYFQHEDLFWLSTVENDGCIVATLTMPLTSGGETIAEHEYDGKDIHELDKKTPAVAIWPDFYDQAWKGGFAAYAAADVDDLSVSPLFQSGRQVQPGDVAAIDCKQEEVRIWQCEEEPAIGFSLSALWMTEEIGRMQGLLC